MKEIRSTKNQLIKDLKKLHQKKYRELENRYLLEGFHLVEEAARNQVAIQMLFFDERGQREWGAWLADQQDPEQYFVTTEVLAALSDLPTPQGIIAVVEKVGQQSEVTAGRWLLLDRVQDPGNVGTMIRTADAAGFTGVVVGSGSADIYSTKVMRSMQGSNFHLPILSMELADAIAALKALGIPVYGTELNVEAVTYHQIAKTDQVGLILGNEGQGVSAEILKRTDKNLYIPIYGQAESLNVGVAAGILMYHFAG